MSETTPAAMASRPHIVVPPPGPRSRALAERLSEAECPEVTYLSDDFPVFWSRAKGCLVEDVDANTYLDFTAAFAVASIGHTHPEVVSAIQRQAESLIHGMGDVHPTALKVELAEELAAITPGNLGQTLFSSSGAEAVESARKSCAMATGKAGLIAFSGAYHGLTYGALEATSRQDFRRGFEAQWAGTVTHMPYPHCYRCPFRKTHPECDLVCLAHLEQALTDPGSGLGEMGGVLIEPVQGRGGTIVPPPGYLRRLRELCDKHGLLLIFDEIYTGFGRTGAWFAADLFEVFPDLMTVGKAMGGGLPISACLGTPAVMNAWGRSAGEAIHTSTFLGNPLACAAALAALKVMKREDVPMLAREKGQYLLAQLAQLKRKYPEIGDIRGVGLMVGIELVEDRQTRRPATALTISLMKQALREGLLILPEGTRGNVIGINPPLTIEKAEIDWGVGILDRCLERLAGPASR